MNVQVERRKEKISKKPDNQQEGNKTQNSNADSKGKRKVKFLCLICEGDHFTK